MSLCLYWSLVIGGVGDRVEIGLWVLWIMLLWRHAHVCAHRRNLVTIICKKNKLQSEMQSKRVLNVRREYWAYSSLRCYVWSHALRKEYLNLGLLLAHPFYEIVVFAFLACLVIFCWKQDMMYLVKETLVKGLQWHGDKVWGRGNIF